MDRNLEILLTSHIDFLFIFEQCGNNCKYNLFLKRKVGVTERPRALNPNKAIAMTICPIIVHFSTCRARSMHDVACEFARAAVRSKDAQKQFARTSLNIPYSPSKVQKWQNALVSLVNIMSPRRRKEKCIKKRGLWCLQGN